MDVRGLSDLMKSTYGRKSVIKKEMEKKLKKKNSFINVKIEGLSTF